MSNTGYIIPRDIHGETAYIHATDDYIRVIVIPNNGTRLGMSSDEKDDWHILRGERDLINTDLESPLTRTTKREQDLHDNGIDFIDFATPIINRMKVILTATSTDAAVFRFTIGRADPSHHTVAIEAGALGHSHGLGGGKMKIPCHLLGSTPHIPFELGADAVEIAYVTGDRVPTGPEDNTTKFISKKSRVIVSVDPSLRGKKFSYYKRWINTSFPALNGPWSSLEDDLIL